MTGVTAVCAVMGLGAAGTFGLAGDLVRDRMPAPWQRPAESGATIGPGGIAAARWLRSHSSPDDLVATNAHCRLPDRPVCDARTFWLSAYSERHVLIEGWAYEPRSLQRARELDLPFCCLPFWDQDRLTTNDAALEGDEDAIAALRTRYGVRWMVVDDRAPNRVGELAQSAAVRWRSGAYAVLELPTG